MFKLKTAAPKARQSKRQESRKSIGRPKILVAIVGALMILVVAFLLVYVHLAPKTLQYVASSSTRPSSKQVLKPLFVSVSGQYATIHLFSDPSWLCPTFKIKKAPALSILNDIKTISLSTTLYSSCGMAGHNAPPKNGTLLNVRLAQPLPPDNYRVKVKLFKYDIIPGRQTSYIRTLTTTFQIE